MQKDIHLGCCEHYFACRSARPVSAMNKALLKIIMFLLQFIVIYRGVMQTVDAQGAVAWLRAQAVIAYPTESVFGLGCDAFSKSACERIWQLKSRSEGKGFIVLIPDVASAKALVSDEAWDYVKAHPQVLDGVSCVFPASSKAPNWCLKGGSIALRITTHAECLKMCQRFQGPIVSTSANISGGPPATSNAALQDVFSGSVPAVLEGQPLALPPTRVFEPLTGQVYR